MTHEPDPEALAKAIVDTNLYMVLGTADEAGRPLGFARVLRARAGGPR